MKKKYWIVHSNIKENKFWIEGIMLDPNSEYFKDYGSSYSSTLEEAKERFKKRIMNEIDRIDQQINSLEGKERILYQQLENIEIKDNYP